MHRPATTKQGGLVITHFSPQRRREHKERNRLQNPVSAVVTSPDQEKRCRLVVIIKRWRVSRNRKAAVPRFRRQMAGDGTLTTPPHVAGSFSIPS